VFDRFWFRKYALAWGSSRSSSAMHLCSVMRLVCPVPRWCRVSGAIRSAWPLGTLERRAKTWAVGTPAEGNMDSANALEQLTTELARLPGIGAKTADRLAYHLLKVPREEALSLASAIRRLREQLRQCVECRDYTERDRCRICEEPTRDRSQLCVVEQSRDLHALELSGSYRGLYHVLGGNFAPLDDRGAETLSLPLLVERVRGGAFQEVIIATNPDFEGDGTALLVAEQLAPLGVRISRLARGVPAGSQLEYMNRSILRDALLGRQHYGPAAASSPPAP
jgi:recombination protein RecR